MLACAHILIKGWLAMLVVYIWALVSDCQIHSQVPPLTAMWPQINHFSALCISLLMCKTKILKKPLRS